MKKREQVCGVVLLTAVGCALLVCAMGASNTQWFTLPLTVPNGGTGAATLTGLVKGNGASAMTAAAAGTDYVAPDGELTAIAGLTSAASKVPKFTGSGTAALVDEAVYTRSVISLGAPPLVSPADSTVYYFGSQWGTAPQPSSDGVWARYYFPAACRIKSAYGFFTNQNACSNEASTIAIRKNSTTDTTISASVVLINGLTTFNNTSLDIAIAAGDYVEIKWTAPAWATNPSNTRPVVNLGIEAE